MAGGLQTSRGGQGPGGITNFTALTTGAVQTVNLVAPSNTVVIINYSSSTILSVDFNGGTPTASGSGGNGIQIAAGADYEYDGCPLNSFSLIGSAGSSLYGVVAH